MASTVYILRMLLMRTQTDRVLIITSYSSNAASNQLRLSHALVACYDSEDYHWYLIDPSAARNQQLKLDDKSLARMKTFFSDVNFAYIYGLQRMYVSRDVYNYLSKEDPEEWKNGTARTQANKMFVVLCLVNDEKNSLLKRNK